MAINPTVKVNICYNAFDLTDIVQDEIQYERGQSLAHYLHGLPDDVDWRIGLNNEPVEIEELDKVIPKANDSITLVVIPRGGDVKDILRIVAMIALVVAASYLFGPMGTLVSGFWGSVALAATLVVGSLLINTLLPPSSGLKADEAESNSYGYDGAKNTAREGVTLPVVYGKFWVAGNYIDLFTENVGDDQYLYGRLALSDGEIDGLFDEPEINEQPISNFTNVTWNHTKGTFTETKNEYFGRSIAQHNRQIKLSTTWQTYTTTTDVDAFQCNFVFPRGLVHLDDENNKKHKAVTVEIRYRPNGSSTWLTAGGEHWQEFNGLSPTASTKYLIQTKGVPTTTNLSETVTYTIQYRLNGTGAWTTYETITQDLNNYQYEPDFDYTSVPDYTNDYAVWDHLRPNRFTYSPSASVLLREITLPSGAYEFRVTGNGTLVNSYYLSANPVGTTGSSTVRYRDNRIKAIRKTHEVRGLINATYDIDVRRTNAQSEEETTSDEIWLTDIGEIQNTNVAIRTVATGWFKIKMSEQLNGIPNILWPVKGVKVDIYDANGTVTSTEWSDNPADIALDMLISERRGALRDKVQIDFPAYVAWREYCETQGLKYNAVLDTTQTLWDALQTVYRVGRATPTRIGSRLSVIVDKPAQPVMLFGPGNIYKESFAINYLPLADRANEFEMSYYDKNDKNKQKTIRIADPTAAQAGEIPKSSAYRIEGIDNFAQAQKEVWYQLYQNRLAKRTITFDAPIESIGLNLGDVALIQHDMVEWGTSGRVRNPISTTQIQLDKLVTIEAGNTYSLLLIYDQLQKATASIAAVSGLTYSLTGISDTSLDEELAKKLTTNDGSEATIDRWDWTGANSATIVLSKAVTGATATIWDVDAIVERTVSTGASTTDTVTLSTALPAVPNTYCNYMFGINSEVRKPYRLRSISGEDFERRSLTFVEYNELVYSPPEYDIPEPAVKAPKTPAHVKDVSLITEPTKSGSGNKVVATLSWSSGHITRYGGVDIYVSINESDYIFYNTVLGVNQAQLELTDQDLVGVKVVSFNDQMLRAAPNGAPEISQRIVSAAATVAPPSALVWTNGRFSTVRSGTLSWTKPTSASTFNLAPLSRVQVKLSGTSTWIDKGTTNGASLDIGELPAGLHSFRVRSENGTGSISSWVETTSLIAAPATVDPTVPLGGTAIDHVLNDDGSASLSFEWIWSGNERDIDGFEVILYRDTTSTPYTIGTTPVNENIIVVPRDKRVFFLEGVAANSYYTLYVRTYKNVHTSFSTNGVLRSNPVKSLEAGENPYRPSSTVAFAGTLTGTVDFSNVTGTTRPSDYAGSTYTWTSIGSAGVTVRGNSFSRATATGDYNACVVGPPFSGTIFITQKHNDGIWNIISLDDDATASAHASMKFQLQTSTTNYYLYNDGLLIASGTNAALNSSAKYLSLAYDGVSIRGYVDGTQLFAYSTAIAAGSTFYPKVHAYSHTSTISDLQAGPYTDRAWSQIGGTGRPADNATVNNVTHSSSAPTSPVNGDVWVDTSVTPNVVRVRVSGAWQIASNLVTQGTHIGVDNGASTPDFLVTNPKFVEWPTGSTYPTGWSSVFNPGGGTATKVAGLGTANSMQIQTVASFSFIQSQQFGSTTIQVCSPNQYMLMECDIRLVTGAFTGLGMRVEFYGSDNLLKGTLTIDPAVDKDTTGTVVGAGTAGSEYSWRKTIKVPAGSYYYYVAADSALASYGSIAASKTVIWRKIALRAANDMEIKTYNQEEGADVTRVLQAPPSQVIAYDYTGTTTTQLPKIITWTLMAGANNVSASATWSYTATGCTIDGTGCSAGQRRITAVTAANASIQATATYASQERSASVAIQRTLASPPSGSSGGTFPSSYSTSLSATISDTSYDGTPQTLFPTSAQIQSSSSGQIRFVLNAEYEVFSGNGSLIAKAQYSTDNSTWTDVSGASGTGSSATAGYHTDVNGNGIIDAEDEYIPGTVGNLSVNTLVSGFTASTNYYIRWIAYKSGTTSSFGVSGTASGAQS